MIHSVRIDYKRCRGCTSCIKSCPTEAIRVRSGKAVILSKRCIDCGSCIQVCPHRAIQSVSDPLEKLEGFRYRVAVPDPALYGQFQNLTDVNLVLGALLKIGFDDVYEAARAAELLSDYGRQRKETWDQRPRPQLTSACPTVLRIIKTRFPDLIPHLSPIISPVELAAILARRRAAERTGLDPKEIGVFSIVPCSAKVTAASNPDRLAEPVLDGAFAIRDIYPRLLGPMAEMNASGEIPELSGAGVMGIGWAYSGGESAARLGDKCVAVDGILNCIRMLEAIEDGRLPDADLIELGACVRGCVGGCLTVENPFSAQLHIRNLMHGMPMSRNQFDFTGEDRSVVLPTREIEYQPVFVLDEDRSAAMEKMAKIEELEHQLPGLRCGSCGAPSCRAFAEDVVLGRADRSDCIFTVRERTEYMAGTDDVDEFLPAPFRQSHRRREEDNA